MKHCDLRAPMTYWRKWGLLAVMAPLALLALSMPAHAKWVEFQGKMLDIATPGEAVPNQMVVVAETAEAQREIPAMARKLGAVILDDIREARAYLFKLPGENELQSAMKAVGRLKGKFHAYPNYKMSIPAPPGVMEQLMEREGMEKFKARKEIKPQPSGDVTTQLYTTNDPSVSNQYWLWRVKEPLCPTPATGAKGIAIIDTGVDYTHPDLAGKVVKVWDYVDYDNDPMDEEGHGTHCAGIAAANANNATGIRGISPNSTIYAYRVLDESGSGTYFDIMSGIFLAASNPSVHVLSLSLGGYVYEDSSEYIDLKAAVDYAVVTKGKIVVVAAGNEDNLDLYDYQYSYGGSPTYRPVPAWYPNSFTVGATTEADYRAYFSNYDVSATSYDGYATYNFSFVDIVAPGVNILSTYPADQHVQMSGTSMATPMVAGACARLWDHHTTWPASSVTGQLVAQGLTLAGANGFPASEKRLDIFKAIWGGGITGGFLGQIVHGEKGYPVDGVTVEALDGATVAATATSNRGGFYYFTTLDPAKSYTLRFSKTGFVTRQVSAGNPLSSNLKDLKMEFIAPSRPSSGVEVNWRIIVYWKSCDPGYYEWYYDSSWYYQYVYQPYNVAGMEANAWLRTPSYYEIGYTYGGSLTASPYVKYMHDSYFSTPIETHVIRNQEIGTYSYWVSTDPYESGWGSIKYAPGTPYYPMYPVVVIYKGDTLVKTIYSSTATRDGSGTKYWHAFDLNANTVTTVNTITDTLP